jgi:starch-binding outer membrane protein, SusD/RagB family
MKKIFLVMAIIYILTSCENVLDKYPHSAVAPGGISEKDLPALEAGMYNKVQNNPGTVSWILNDVLGGTLAGSTGVAIDIINNTLSPLNGSITNSWNGYFTALYQVNNVITITDGLEPSTTRNTINGEAHYFRALIYYYLVTRWGDVPILRKNTLDLVKRDPVADVWKFIEEDIETAISLLGTSSNYYFVSKDAAVALKARVMLSQGKNNEAATNADALIGTGKYQLDAFEKIFRKQQNTEIIFAFESLTSESTLNLGNYFYSYANPSKGSYVYRPIQSVMDMYELTDNRKAISVDNVGGNNCINKYPAGQSGTDPFVISRIAEMYLISAEAHGRTAEGLSLLNTLRNKRGLLSISPKTDDEFINSILLERKKELLAEGFMYYDLVRTGKAISTLGILPYQLLLPIPGYELRLNPNLKPNPGY